MSVKYTRDNPVSAGDTTPSTPVYEEVRQEVIREVPLADILGPSNFTTIELDISNNFSAVELVEVLSISKIQEGTFEGVYVGKNKTFAPSTPLSLPTINDLNVTYDLADPFKGIIRISSSTVDIPAGCTITLRILGDTA